MERKHPSKIDVREHVAVKNEKGILARNKAAVLSQRSCAAEKLRLLCNTDPDAGLLPRGKFPDGRSMSVRVDQNVSDARRLTVVEPNLQQRDSLNLQQALGDAVR